MSEELGLEPGTMEDKRQLETTRKGVPFVVRGLRFSEQQAGERKEEVSSRAPEPYVSVER